MTSASLSRTWTAASPLGGGLGPHALREPHLGLGVEVGGLQPGLGEGEFLGRAVRCGLFGGLGGLDVLDQLLLRLGLRRDDHGLPPALRLLDCPQLLDGLLLLGDRTVHRDALADDLGDLPLLRLDLLVGGDPGQRGLPLAGDDLQQAVLLDALALHGDDPLAVLRGDGDLTRLVLPLHAQLFLGAQEGALRPQPLLLDHPRGLRLLAGAHGLDLPLLLDLRVGLPPLELQDRLARVDVLPGDLLLLVALRLVGAHVLHRGQLGDLADALRVEDVARVELGERRLLQVVDRGVLEVVAVQVDADDLDDAVPQFLALGVEVGEVHLLADGLQRLGELRVEQLLKRVTVTGAGGPDGLRDLHDVLDGLVDLDEERDADVRADVVPADQSFLA